MVPGIQPVEKPLLLFSCVGKYQISPTFQASKDRDDIGEDLSQSQKQKLLAETVNRKLLPLPVLLLVPGLVQFVSSLQKNELRTKIQESYKIGNSSTYLNWSMLAVQLFFIGN